MSYLKTPTVPISKVDVDPDYDVRTYVDEKEFDGLAAGLACPVI